MVGSYSAKLQTYKQKDILPIWSTAISFSIVELIA